MTQQTAPILVAGAWRASQAIDIFQRDNPSTGEPLPEHYPVSPREEVLEIVAAGSAAAGALRAMSGANIAEFLEAYAAAIEQRSGEIVEMAHLETGLPKSPRLKDAELPRTTDQLRQAARAVREGSWRRPIRDDARKIYSMFGPLGGPVVVMGPNNFPFAYNSVAGGDFAAAIAAHNPVIAKAHPSHPGTTKLLAELARECVQSTGLPPATVQMLYHARRETGLELVAHPLVGATGFTGGKRSGLELKAAADRAGKPIYLEMSSVNPVVVLAGALRERGGAIADEFYASCTLGAGQFCTNPGLVIIPGSDDGRNFAEAARQKFEAAAPGVLLGRGGREGLQAAVAFLQQHGAQLLCGGQALPGHVVSLCEHAAAGFGRRLSPACPRVADGGVWPRGAAGRFPGHGADRRHPRSIGRQLDWHHLLGHDGPGRGGLCRPGTAIAPARRAADQRPHANGRGGQPRHEPRRAVSRHGASGLYGRRHSHEHSALRRAAMLRQRPAGTAAAGIAALIPRIFFVQYPFWHCPTFHQAWRVRRSSAARRTPRGAKGSPKV